MARLLSLSPARLAPVAVLTWMLLLPCGSAPTGSRGVAHAQARPGSAEAERVFHDAAQHFLADDVDAARQTVERGLADAPDHPKLLALRDVLDRPGPKAQPDSGRGGANGAPQQGERPNDGGAGASSGSESAKDGAQNASPPSSADRHGGGQQDGTRPSGSPGGRSSASPPATDRPGAPAESTPDERASGEAASGENASGDDASNPSPPDDAPDDGSPRDATPNDGRQGGDATQDGDAASDGASPDRGRRPSDRLSRSQAERILQALEGQEKQLLREVQKRSARPQSVEKDW